MQVRFVDDGKTFRREGTAQLFRDQILGSHGFGVRLAAAVPCNGGITVMVQCQDLRWPSQRQHNGRL
jgi:hypothetical protein